MQWHDIRQHYPNQWLLVEALAAHSEGGNRLLDQLAVLETFPDSVSALWHYAQLHRDTPERELYVFHTDRETLHITERHWLGVRLAL